MVAQHLTERTKKVSNRHGPWSRPIADEITRAIARSFASRITAASAGKWCVANPGALISDLYRTVKAFERVLKAGKALSYD